MSAPRRARFLVVGPGGQVGHELVRGLRPLGEVLTAGRGPAALLRADLGDPRSLAEAVRAARPDIVLNAAAHTAVDRAESEPELARRENADGPAALAQACARGGHLLVHLSTDYVFDGQAQRPWREEDVPGPLSVYGRTKLEGEEAVKASGALHLILRTAWVYARRGRNFLLTMERLFRERPEVTVVNDQHGSPTWARALAEAVGAALARLQTLGGDLDPAAASGVYHATCAGSTTWYGFARAIHRRLHATCRLTPIATADYPTPARRPAYSVLDGARLARVFGVRLPDWEAALERCLTEPA